MEPIISKSYFSRDELFFNKHHEQFGMTFLKNDAASTTTAEGRKIIKQGTVYPTNDANAIGIILYDIDVTDGDARGAVIYHGALKEAKMPTAPSANAITALKGREVSISSGEKILFI